MVSSTLFYSIYPFAAAVLCILLMIKAHRSQAAIPYIKFFANLAVINVSQTVIYAVMPFSVAVASYAADIYLIAAYFLFAHFMQLALSLSEEDRGTWPSYLYIAPMVLTVMHFSGVMIESYRIENGIILHNDGTYSWAFDLFLLLSSLVTVVTFKINQKKIESNYVLISKNMIAYYSFFPFIVATVMLVIFSNTGYTIPVVVIIPTMSLYLLFVFYYITKTNIIDLTISPKSNLARIKLTIQSLNHYDTKKDIDSHNRAFQQQIFKETMERNENNLKAASKTLECDPKTVRNILKG